MTSRAPHYTDDLARKACIVIGGGSIAPGWGIGKALSVAYARAGAKVLVCDRNFDAAVETAAIIEGEGRTAIACALDATNQRDVENAVQTAQEAFGSIDVLHNNVGIGKAGDSDATTADDWRAISDANLLALHIATQAVIPHMKRQRSGVILTTSTVASLRFLGFPHLAYGVTKAATNQFCRLIAAEYAPFGIRANSLVAGLIDTPRIRLTLQKTYATSEEEMVERRNRQVPLGFMGDGWDVAHAAVFLASDKARYISGAELVIDGALTTTSRT